MFRDRLRRSLAPVGDDRGAVATEYGLVLTLVVLAMVVAVTAFGFALVRLFDQGVAPF